MMCFVFSHSSGYARNHIIFKSTHPSRPRESPKQETQTDRQTSLGSSGEVVNGPFPPPPLNGGCGRVKGQRVDVHL